ncbi:MAG: hypothetical protein LBB11_03570 [Puniceicoccales bacterium]|nr:hypothetical protein [Puniceicoccales bacterium]
MKMIAGTARSMGIEIVS